MRSAHSKQKKHSHTNSAVSRQVYMHALLVQHLQSVSVYFFNNDLVCSKIRKSLDVEKAENQLKYTNCAEIKKITIRIYSNCMIYSSLFFKSFKSHCCSFCLIEKKLQITAYFIFYFLVDFSKEKGGFYCYFFKWAFLKKTGVFFGSFFLQQPW